MVCLTDDKFEPDVERVPGAHRSLHRSVTSVRCVIVHTSSCPRGGCEAEILYESGPQLPNLLDMEIFILGHHLERPDPDCRVIETLCHRRSGTVVVYQEWVNESPPGGPVLVHFTNEEIFQWAAQQVAK